MDANIYIVVGHCGEKVLSSEQSWLVDAWTLQESAKERAIELGELEETLMGDCSDLSDYYLFRRRQEAAETIQSVEKGDPGYRFDLFTPTFYSIEVLQLKSVNIGIGGYLL
jgi:hypothetical protein